MLRDSYYTPPTLLDEQVFAALVPHDHYLRRVAAVLDFERYSVIGLCWRPATVPRRDGPPTIPC